MYFLQDPLKAFIFYPIRFLYVLSKKPLNKDLLETHDYYFMFKTFFTQVNNKVFFRGGDPSPQIAIAVLSNIRNVLLIEYNIK